MRHDPKTLKHKKYVENMLRSVGGIRYMQSQHYVNAVYITPEWRILCYTYATYVYMCFSIVSLNSCQSVERLIRSYRSRSDLR